MAQAQWAVRRTGEKMVRLTANTIWQDYQAEQKVRARCPSDDWWSQLVPDFGFLTPHILRKALIMQPVGFSTISVSREDEYRWSGTVTALDNIEYSVQALSQPSLTPVTTSTAVHQESCFYQLFQQTQSLLSGFIQKEGKPSTERRPFYDFIIADNYIKFQREVFHLVHSYKCGKHQQQPQQQQ